MLLSTLLILTSFGSGLVTAEQSRIPIDPSFYSILQRYTEFSAASLVINLGKPCPHPPSNSVILDTIVINSTNTQVTIFRDDAAKEFIVSFPGSTSVQDFITDFSEVLVDYVSPGVNCIGCKVHYGFLTAYNSIVDDLQVALNKHTARHPDYIVTPTGHSLGGALAAMAYPSLKGLAYHVKYGYTFGQFRVGDAATAAYIDKLADASDTEIGEFRRTTHTFDGVPQTPKQSQGYQHSRTEFFELDDKSGNQSAARTYRCFGNEPADGNDSMGRGFVNKAHLYYTGLMMTGNEGCGS